VGKDEWRGACEKLPAEIMMQQVYSCEICKEITKPLGLIGCRFSGRTKFVLSGARETDGTHICFGCMKQILDQANIALEMMNEPA